MIGIMEYGIGNIRSFVNIYNQLNIPHKIIRKKEDLFDVTKIILPGVGAFDDTINSLNRSGLREELDVSVLEKKIPVLGICIGMQMMASSSEEGSLPGLGWIDGTVRKIEIDRNKLSYTMPLPHMGWNEITVISDSSLLKDINCNRRFYFLHSYYFETNSNKLVLATANYGDDFCCILSKDNIYAVQFHPEKSHSNGMKLLKNFWEL